LKSRIPRLLARRIDRLARQAHRFHRYAHHPLCGRYQGELVALGKKTRVCRGCASACAGLALGAALGALQLWPFELSVVGAALVAPLALLVALRLRASKLLTRAFPAALATFLGAQALRELTALASAVLCLDIAVAAAALLWYRRRGPDRSACADCPERVLQPCSGLLPIVRRERAFRRLAGKWLAT